jgi:NAD(P)H-hydrate epimerase
MRALTREQVREIDRRAIEEFHIPGIVLMENAARGAAVVAWEMIGRDPRRSVLMFCGPGNNGGDGLAAARHLHNRGVNVEMVPVFDPAKLGGDALTNWQIVDAMKLETISLDNATVALQSEPDLVIDALLGTGATGEPRDRIKFAIDLINSEAKCPVLAIDVPSGLDCDSGQPASHTVRASHTCTFVAWKRGFSNPEAAAYLGVVHVADIGAPRKLVHRIEPGALSELPGSKTVYLRWQEFEQGLAAASLALEIDPENAEALCHRGAALMALGRQEDALTALDKALSINPYYTDGHVHRGIAELRCVVLGGARDLIGEAGRLSLDVANQILGLAS